VLYRGGDPRVAELAARVELRIAEMTDDTVAGIVAEMKVYGSERFVPVADLRRSVVDNLQVALRTLQGAGAPDLTRATTTGRVRALQGAPLPELVRAYRIGLTEVWRRVVDLLDDGRPGDLAALVAATTAIWALADDYAEALTTAYRGASTEVVLAHQARRSALVEALFAGGASTEGMLWDIARVLGLTVEGDFVVVVAETPALGQEPLDKVEARLRELHHESAWRLTPDLQAGVVSLRRPNAAQDVLELVGAATEARVGMSPVYSGLANTARALHFARVALSSLTTGVPGTVQFTESPLAGLVASAPEASVQLAHQVLGPVLDLPGEEGNVLLLTLRAWFDSQGSTNLTAERMFCHPNTIRLRLKRITEELGRPLSDPEHIAEVGAALRALNLFPGTDHLPTPPAR
jgi:hypothetical protein